jgi:EAL domain-containing protein (putative c-di-GMP-specific phosphodiesterase class I)
MQPKDVTIRIDAVSIPGAPRAVILLVENDRDEGQRVSQELIACGFDVEVETNVAKAKERLLFERFRAVVCSLDGGQGLELLTLARAYDAHMPFMLLVDEHSLGSVGEAIRLGSTQYALKPVVVSRLVDALREGFAKHAKARAAKVEIVRVSDHLTQALAQAYMALQKIVLVHADGTREVYAYEALLRSDYEALSSPLDILNIAEQSQRVQDVGRRARSIAAEHAHALADGTLLFVNLHARELNDEQLYDPTTRLSAAANRIVLEITEREDVKNVQGLEQKLVDLRMLGFRIAIDDLGAGYAGLTSFATLEPDYAKLDLALVRGIHQSLLRQRVVRSVVGLAQELDIIVVAEGVEFEEEFECLRSFGIRYFQGYLLGRPNPTRIE